MLGILILVLPLIALRTTVKPPIAMTGARRENYHLGSGDNQSHDRQPARLFDRCFTAFNMATPVTGIRIPADLLALIDAREIEGKTRTDIVIELIRSGLGVAPLNEDLGHSDRYTTLKRLAWSNPILYTGSACCWYRVWGLERFRGALA